MSPRRSEIRIDPIVLEEREDGEVAVSLGREHVARVELARGTPAERPILQLGLGVLSAGGAAWMLWRVALFLWAGRASGGGWATLAGGSVIALVIAVAMIRRVLARREYLRVSLHDGTRRKVLLPVDLSHEERAEVIARLHEHGWPFVRSRV